MSNEREKGSSPTARFAGGESSLPGLYDRLQTLEPKEELDEKGRLRAMTRPLLEWYGAHARVLPWRESKESPPRLRSAGSKESPPRLRSAGSKESPIDPYQVWISEIMLQQTRVEAVKPYFKRFMEALPDIKSLAEVPEDRLLKLWEGLGYYSRARNLKKAAAIVVEDYGGQLPASFEALKLLPGIGSYTAGAIASIAFGIPVPAVDGNVLRVITRVVGSREDILKQSVKKRIESILQEVMPQTGVGDYNQALIEVGAIVCVPNGAPLCLECPMASLCVARRDDLTGEIPVKTPKKARRIEEKTILLLFWSGRVAIRKRGEDGLLASMYEFPNLEGYPGEQEIAALFSESGQEVRSLPEAKHIFSHVEWHMKGYSIELQEKPEGDYLWVTPEEVRETYSLPSAFKVYTKMIR